MQLSEMDAFIEKDVFGRDFSGGEFRNDVITRDEALQNLKDVIEIRTPLADGESVNRDLYGRGKRRVLLFHPQSPRAIRRSLPWIESNKDSADSFRSPTSLRIVAPGPIMVGTISRAGPSDIRVLVPDHDASHNANSINSASLEINGHHTDFLLQPFSDRVFIIVTQLQKMGTILSAEREVTVAGAESFAVRTIMGKRDIPEMELCARAIISSMAGAGCEKSLLLSLALKDHSMRTMRAIIENINELSVW